MNTFSSLYKPPVIGIRIREATEADGAELTELALAAKRHWGYSHDWLDAWRNEVSYAPEVLARELVWCALPPREERIVGVASLARDPSAAELVSLWVHPEWIGRGIGTKLFQTASAAARKLGARTLRVVTDPNAEPFYRRLGATLLGMQPSVPAGRQLPVLRIDLAEATTRG